ncbi:hypothetical protein EAI_11371 [Harpegnathos saltator]|uniref:Uncharacterized protein n=1 Tax=Harpegnathos saltator TaxID=610380 RepID=E2BX00_HARSA|nr:hypothetical protein EAI_11371 [Harpegnathos saltator]
MSRIRRMDNNNNEPSTSGDNNNSIANYSSRCSRSQKCTISATVANVDAGASMSSSSNARDNDDDPDIALKIGRFLGTEQRTNSHGEDNTDDGTASTRLRLVLNHLRDYEIWLNELLLSLTMDRTRVANVRSETLPLFTDETYLRNVWFGIPWRSFWTLVFPRMCEIVNYIDVPQRAMHPAPEFNSSRRVDPHEPCRLFSPIRLRSSIDRLRGNDSGTTSSSISSTTNKTEHNNNNSNNHNDVEIESTDEQNDRVYSMMWNEILHTVDRFVRTIWLMLAHHAQQVATASKMRATGNSNEPSLYYVLRESYENAMLLGRVALAAPLSLFAPLSTMQTMNDLQLRRLLTNRCKYGRVYRCVISITTLNAVYYSMLARGLRPKNSWHVSTATWPIFAANHAALAMKHFSGDLIDGGLTLNTAREYTRSHARLSNGLLTAGPYDSLTSSNHTDLANFVKYLNLTVTKQTLPTNFDLAIHRDIFAPNRP